MNMTFSNSHILFEPRRPELGLLDIGANLGVYTLPAAHMRRQVVAVALPQHTQSHQSNLEAFWNMLNWYKVLYNIIIIMVYYINILNNTVIISCTVHSEQYMRCNKYNLYFVRGIQSVKYV